MSEATRKLATIVALDVAGYSARTEADEARATAEVAGLRGVIEGIAKRHAGRVFNTAGDGFMLEFGSSLAAVEAALALAEACEPKVRVGVHLGDVVVQPNGDLLGHGVNVAARLMAQAAPGSALVSADVRRTIRGPLAERLVSRGLIQLDKMTETIEAFALAAVASAIVAAPPKIAEPMLAVLPFDNLSNDPEMQFFSDGVSEEIQYALTHGAGFNVIGRTSSFQFRGAEKRNAARELRATHVLDGAVRKSGQRMRLTAQLTEVATNRCLWTDRYDREIADAFALQDEIAGHVAAALKSFIPGRAVVETVDPATYELFLQARSANREVSDDGAVRAEALFTQTVARAPTFARAWAYLGAARAVQLPRDRDALGEPKHTAAMAATQRALELDPTLAMAYAVLGLLKPAFSDHAEKVRLLERALELAPPNDVLVLNSYGGALVSVGRYNEALPHLIRASDLDPMLPWPAASVAATLFAVGRTQDAVASIETARRRMPNEAWIWIIRWAIMFHGGRQDDAAEMLLPTSAIPPTVAPAYVEQLRFLLALVEAPQDQREATLRALLNPGGASPLRLDVCPLAARLGCSDLAFESLFDAFDRRRPIGPVGEGRGLNRAYLGALLFGFGSDALHKDLRFPRLCVRTGHVDYWMTSGRWPDCASAAPYDFKAECAKAAAERGKT